MTERKLERRRLSVGIALGIATSIVLTLGARAQESCVPKDLVRGILGVDAANLYVGAPTPEIVATFPLPPGATTIGGLGRDHGTNLIATLPRPSAQVRDEMKGLLESVGWKVKEDDRQRGGCMARQHEQLLLYCGTDGSMFSYSVQDSADSGSLLSVHRYSKTPMFDPCGEEGSGRNPRRSGPMPALEPPTGVRSSMMGSHGFGPNGARSESVVLATSDAPRELATHFGAQIADQGWTLDSDLVGDSMATQLWSLTDGAGKPWRGMLVIAVLSEEARDASFSIMPRD